MLCGIALDFMSGKSFNTLGRARRFPPTTEVLKYHREREASLQRRSEIYRSGGRGWWSFEDESKVIWPKVSDQKPVKQRPKEVVSLSEAKDFLSTLKLPF
jgi:hypothetical protein